MPLYKLFLLIFSIHLLAVMSPGPDFVMVVKNALQYNRKIALYTTLGISLGIGVHIIYSVAGIAFLLQQNQTLFHIIKYAGMTYIFYIGIRTLMNNKTGINLKNQPNSLYINSLQAVKIGFFTNVLNPKASLFFLSLFSLVIPPNTPLRVLTGISFMLIAVTFLWFSLVSIIFTKPLIVKFFKKHESIIIKLFGVILIIFAVYFLFEQ